VRRYFLRKLFVYAVTFVVAVTIDWAIPHLMPNIVMEPVTVVHEPSEILPILIPCSIFAAFALSSLARRAAAIRRQGGARLRALATSFAAPLAIGALAGVVTFCSGPTPQRRARALVAARDLRENSVGLGELQDELNALRARLPTLDLSFRLNLPLESKLSELSPVQLDLLQAVLNSSTLEAAFDSVPSTDLEAGQALLVLVQRGYLVPAD